MGQRFKIVLAFHNPLLNLEKPSMILLKIVNQVITTFNGQVRVNWGAAFHQLIQKLVRGENLSNLKRILLMPYLMHIYSHEECLIEKELSTYNDQDILQQWNMNLTLTVQVVEEERDTQSSCREEKPIDDDKATESKKTKVTPIEEATPKDKAETLDWNEPKIGKEVMVKVVVLVNNMQEEEAMEDGAWKLESW